MCTNPDQEENGHLDIKKNPENIKIKAKKNY